jgi:hypothetical protein
MLVRSSGGNAHCGINHRVDRLRIPSGEDEDGDHPDTEDHDGGKNALDGRFRWRREKSSRLIFRWMYPYCVSPAITGMMTL